MKREELVPVIVSLLVVFGFIGLVLVALNPFKTYPSISVVSAYWSLGPSGYRLIANISTTGHAQLRAVEVAGRFVSTVRDVDPPASLIEVPLPAKSDTVRLHFDVGSPIEIRPEDRVPGEAEFTPVFGDKYLFFLGSVPQPYTAFVVPVLRNLSVVMVVKPGSMYAEEIYMEREFPHFTGDIVEADQLSLDTLLSYTTIIFNDVAPSPALLDDLLRLRKAVVLLSLSEPLGRYELVVENGSLVLVEGGGDIDFFEASCTYQRYDVVSRFYTEALKYLAPRGVLETYQPVSPSEFCRNQFSTIYAELTDGSVALGKTKRGFYYASIDKKAVLMLAMMGFFEGVQRSISVFEGQPFAGIKIISFPYEDTDCVVSIKMGDAFRSVTVQRFPVTKRLAGNELVLVVGDSKEYAGSIARLRVEELSLTGEIIRVLSDTVSELPSTLRLPLNPLRAYVVYANNTPIYLAIDEDILSSPPEVSVTYASICEYFFIEVEVEEPPPSPLFVQINGRTLATLTGKQKFTYKECRPGSYEVRILDIYGQTLKVVTFDAEHIYSNPFFILGVVLLALVGTLIYVSMRLRAQPTAEFARLRFYALPEKPEAGPSPLLIASTVDKMYAANMAAPRAKELFFELYKRKPLLDTILDAAEALKKLLKMRPRNYMVFSRYSPELDDAITLIVKRGTNPYKEYYNTLISNLLTTVGGMGVSAARYRDIIDVDYVVQLDNNLLLLVYAPSSKSIAEAVDRALNALLRMKRFSIPQRFAGVAVVTEPELVKDVNNLIDKILDRDEETTARVLRDMSITVELHQTTRVEWLNHFIIVAVPSNRIVPLLAFTKLDRRRLANKYYRIAMFDVGEQG